MILIEIQRKKIQIEYKAVNIQDLKLLNDINSYDKM